MNDSQGSGPTANRDRAACARFGAAIYLAGPSVLLAAALLASFVQGRAEDASPPNAATAIASLEEQSLQALCEIHARKSAAAEMGAD